MFTGPLVFVAKIYPLINKRYNETTEMMIYPIHPGRQNVYIHKQ